ADFVLGLDRYEARKAIVEWFWQNKLLEDVKPYRHSVGHSYRSHVPIEPYLSDQWYCKVTDDRLAGAALRAMASDQCEGVGSASADASQPRHGENASAKADPTRGKLRFYPSRYAKTFQTWHENIRDWCISRQLWWGHRIPVWRFTNHEAIDGKSDELISSLIQQLIRLKNDGRVALRHAERQNELAPVDLQHSFVC